MCQSSNKTSYYIKTLDINVGNDWEQAFFSFHLALCDMQLTSEVAVITPCMEAWSVYETITS